jgi:protein-S-isoprenylcysteine O-methyltransferase Ste14
VTTSGPYRFVRNPFYLATLIVDAGLCVVAVEPWIAAAYMPLWFAVHLLTIRREERGLAELFGERYEAYRAKVPRLFPWKARVGGLPESEGFSWSNPQLAIGVEWARVVRTLASPLVVFAGARIFARRGAFFTEPDAAEVACAAAAVVLLLIDALLVARSRRLKRAAATERPA